MPMASALMVGLVIGGLARSAWVAASSACLVLFIITVFSANRGR
jgi:hypothetical protein